MEPYRLIMSDTTVHYSVVWYNLCYYINDHLQSALFYIKSFPSAGLSNADTITRVKIGADTYLPIA